MHACAATTKCNDQAENGNQEYLWSWSVFETRTPLLIVSSVSKITINNLALPASFRFHPKVYTSFSIYNNIQED